MTSPTIHDLAEVVRPINARIIAEKKLADAEKRLEVCHAQLAEQVRAIASAHRALIQLVEAADAHVECADACERAREVIAMLEGRKVDAPILKAVGRSNWSAP